MNQELERKMTDRFAGCLVGGAAGDALGYPVEFETEADIFDRYDRPGIREYALYRGKALISDDTQMTLFTAAGLLENTDDPVAAVASAYRDWLITQRCSFRDGTGESTLLDVPELFARRAPGNACLNAISCFALTGYGTIEKPINDSKGCGGVMRVAPAGLYFDGETADRFGAAFAALTHGHELGYLPAAALAHIVHRAAFEEVPLAEAVSSSLESAKKLFPNAAHLDEFTDLMQKAVELAASDEADLDAIHALGEGWVAEEALAIAVYCALKYENDFERAMIAAVNHRGDSDSTGAITGNILGARIGLGAIPKKFTKKLELCDLAAALGARLWRERPGREA